MEYAQDQDRWQPATAAMAAEAHRANPQWADLRARMLASSEARRVLLDIARASVATSGSFDAPTAAFVSCRDVGSSFVNRDDSTRGNPPQGMGAIVDGSSSTGDDRG